MAVSEDYLKLVLDQLSLFGEIETKRMFGGVGLFHEGLMFGKIGGDVFRLKVDEHNQQEYEERAMKPYFSKKRECLIGKYRLKSLKIKIGEGR